MNKSLQEIIHLEAFNLLCGDLIGEGQFRQVFEHAFDPTLVVKVEKKLGTFSNVYEFQVWEDQLYYKPVSKWLAPCIIIAETGRVMIQKRVDPLRESELPKKLPAFMTDLKISNFGKYENRIVLCDYPHILSKPEIGLKSVDWSQ